MKRTQGKDIGDNLEPYLQFSEEELMQRYSQAYPELSIHAPTATPEDVETLKVQVNRLNRELGTLKDYLETWGDPPSPQTLETYRRLEELDAATEDTEEGILKIQEAVHQSKKQ